MPSDLRADSDRGGVGRRDSADLEVDQLRRQVAELAHENDALKRRVGELAAPASNGGEHQVVRPRFSLRLLLLAVTAFCVWLGYQTIRADRQVDAVNYLLSVGATVGLNTEYDSPLYWKPAAAATYYISPTNARNWEWLKNLVGRKYFDQPVRVTFHADASLDETEVEHLEALSDLVYLYLPNEDVSDEVLARLHRAAPRVYVERPGMAFLGIDDQVLRPDRCTVSTVISGTAAEAIGIQANDQLVRLDGRRVANWVDFMRLMSRKKRGDVVAIELLRGGEPVYLDVTLGTRE